VPYLGPIGPQAAEIRLETNRRTAMKATKTKKASENRDQAHYDAGYQVGYEAGFDACIAHIKDAINKVKAKAKEKAKRPKGRSLLQLKQAPGIGT
jgi:hypothetical protein